MPIRTLTAAEKAKLTALIQLDPMARTIVQAKAPVLLVLGQPLPIIHQVLCC